MDKRKKCITSFVLVMLLINLVSAQGRKYMLTKFSTVTTTTVTLININDVNITIDVSAPAASLNYSVTIRSKDYYEVPLPSTIDNMIDGNLNTFVRLYSSNFEDFLVMVHEYDNIVSAAMMLHPVVHTGKTYYPVCNCMTTSVIYVISQNIKADVTITFPVNETQSVFATDGMANVYYGGDTMHVTVDLAGNRVYKIVSSQNLTGSLIESTASVSVYSGCDEYPVDLDYFGFQQVPSTTSIGKHYIIAAIGTTPSMKDYVEIVTTAPNTTILTTVDGCNVTFVQDQGTVIRLYFIVPFMIIDADNPLVVAHFTLRDNTDEYGYAMYYVTPVEYFRSDYYIYTGPAAISEITVVYRSEVENALLLNDNPIQDTAHFDMLTTGFDDLKYGRISPLKPNTLFKLENVAGNVFGGYITGRNQDGKYAATLGQNIKNIKRTCEPLETEIINGCEEKNLCCTCHETTTSPPLPTASTTSNCTQGQVYESNNGKSYCYWSTYPIYDTRDNAKTECEIHNGTLAYLPDQGAKEFILDRVITNQVPAYQQYIGYTVVNDETYYMGSLVTWETWMGPAPNDSITGCAVMHDALLYIDIESCTQYGYAVCSAIAYTENPTSATTTTNPTIPNPTVSTSTTTTMLPIPTVATSTTTTTLPNFTVATSTTTTTLPNPTVATSTTTTTLPNLTVATSTTTTTLPNLTVATSTTTTTLPNPTVNTSTTASWCEGQIYAPAGNDAICYWSTNSYKSMSQASIACEDNGGHLAVIPNNDTQNVVASLGLANGVYYLGYQTKSNYLLTTFGQQQTLPDFVNTTGIYLSGRCVLITGQGTHGWQIGYCTVENRAICSKCFSGGTSCYGLSSTATTSISSPSTSESTSSPSNPFTSDLLSTQSNPTTSQSGPTTSQSGRTTGQSGPTTSQSGPTTGQSGPTTSQSGPTTGQSGPTTSQSGPTTSQSGTTTGQSGPTTSQSGPTTSQSGPTTSQSGPTTSQSGPTTSQSGPTTNQSGPTSSHPGSTSTIPTTSKVKNCSCSCPTGYVSGPVNMTEELENELNRLKKETKVDKKQLSSFKLKKISVADSRPTAQLAGYAGTAVLTFTFGGLIILDLPLLILEIKVHLLGNLL